MTGADIYALFKVHLDGEEFNSDTDALLAMNTAYRKILSERDWEFLKKSSAQPRGFSTLSTITDLSYVRGVWAVIGTQKNAKMPLSKTTYDNRFDENYDYYIDYASGTFNYIASSEPSTWLSYIIDYKYKPADLTMTTSPVWPEEYHALLAYEMIKAYKEADATFDFYKETSGRYEDMRSGLTLWNEEAQICQDN